MVIEVRLMATSRGEGGCGLGRGTRELSGVTWLVVTGVCAYVNVH